MNGGWRAWLRLFAVQGTWNYERMLGVGMGYAAEPLLEDLKTVDPVRHTEAVVRSAEFFNCNPNLAGLALGATARAEYDAVMGDQLFWAGLVPLLVAAALIGVVLGVTWWAVVGFLVLYNLARIATGVWALRTGLDAGMGIGTAIAQSWISKAIEWVGPAAGFGIGAAIPLVAAWYLEDIGWPAAFGALAVAATGVAVTRWFGASLTTVRFTLLALVLLVLFRWMLP
jgi:mannose/fructose/N-acetylgalactosamine-specific phosphotransferase system component IID